MIMGSILALGTWLVVAVLAALSLIPGIAVAFFLAPFCIPFPVFALLFLLFCLKIFKKR